MENGVSRSSRWEARVTSPTSQRHPAGQNKKRCPRGFRHHARGKWETTPPPLRHPFAHRRRNVRVRARPRIVPRCIPFVA
eukprot:gene12671-biopygen21492